MEALQTTIEDINIVLGASPAFAAAVREQTMIRRIDDLEAEKAAAPVCDCQNDDSCFVITTTISEDELEPED